MRLPDSYRLLPVLLLPVLLFASCRPTPPVMSGVATSQDPAGPPSAPLFTDITQAAGISHRYDNGAGDYFTILESLGGGVALLDYDQDGLLDIYATGGGKIDGPHNQDIRGLPGKLYRNEGHWKFADITVQAGLDQSPFYSHGCLACDLNADGWTDLLISGYGGLACCRNTPREAGGRHFVDVTRQVGLTDTRWSTSLACADLFGNGRADLYVCRYLDWSFENHPFCPRRGDPSQRDVCTPQRFQPLPHAVYQNTGETFSDRSPEIGLLAGKGLGVVCADLNADSRPDIYVANDYGDNFLYFNDGQGKFRECGQLAGVAVDDNGHNNGSMGVDVGDYDGTGRPSLFVTNYQGEFHALYRHYGRETFAFQSQAVGLGALGQEYVGFGVSFLDYDNDGWLDVVVTNGHVLRYPVGAPFAQRSVVLRNESKQDRRTFREVRDAAPFLSQPILGRGLAVGDLDNDGWLDVVISQTNGPLTVLRNNGQASPNAHWIGITLVGRNNRPIVGATVSVKTSERTLTQFSKSGASYLSTNDPRLHFGLGRCEEIEEVTVQWPWGDRQRWGKLEIDRYWRLTEGEPEASGG